MPADAAHQAASHHAGRRRTPGSVAPPTHTASEPRRADSCTEHATSMRTARRTGRAATSSHPALEPRHQFGIGHLLSSSAETTRRLTATPLVPHGSRPLRALASAAQNASPHPGVGELRSGNIPARPSARNSRSSLGISTLNSRQKQFSKWHCKASLGWYSLVKKQLGRLPKLTFRLS